MARIYNHLKNAKKRFMKALWVFIGSIFAFVLASYVLANTPIDLVYVPDIGAYAYNISTSAQSLIATGVFLTVGVAMGYMALYFLWFSIDYFRARKRFKRALEKQVKIEKKVRREELNS